MALYSSFINQYFFWSDHRKHFGSIYLAFVLNGGVGVVETYVERASLVNKFEYGHSRLGGSIAGAVAAFVGGIIFTQNPNSIFWLCSFMATILTGLVIFGDKVNLKSSEVPVEEKNEVTRKEIFTLFKNMICQIKLE